MKKTTNRDGTHCTSRDITISRSLIKPIHRYGCQHPIPNLSDEPEWKTGWQSRPVRLLNINLTLTKSNHSQTSNIQVSAQINLSYSYARHVLSKFRGGSYLQQSMQYKTKELS